MDVFCVRIHVNQLSCQAQLNIFLKEIWRCLRVILEPKTRDWRMMHLFLKKKIHADTRLLSVTLFRYANSF